MYKQSADGKIITKQFRSSGIHTHDDSDSDSDSDDIVLESDSDAEETGGVAPNAAQTLAADGLIPADRVATHTFREHIIGIRKEARERFKEEQMAELLGVRERREEQERSDKWRQEIYDAFTPEEVAKLTPRQLKFRKIMWKYEQKKFFQRGNAFHGKIYRWGQRECDGAAWGDGDIVVRATRDRYDPSKPDVIDPRRNPERKTRWEILRDHLQATKDDVTGKAVRKEFQDKVGPPPTAWDNPACFR